MPCPLIVFNTNLTKNWGASQLVLGVKNPPAHAGDVRDVGSIPGSGRSPGEGHGNPLQYSCLTNPMDRGTQATVHRVTKSGTRLKQLSMHVPRIGNLEFAFSRKSHWDFHVFGNPVHGDIDFLPLSLSLTQYFLFVTLAAYSKIFSLKVWNLNTVFNLYLSIQVII